MPQDLEQFFAVVCGLEGNGRANGSKFLVCSWKDGVRSNGQQNKNGASKSAERSTVHPQREK
jgi:hypothetical protein